ncbi:hypothetical protein [Actinoplanes sp. NPDC020271]|uniref:hypothetical protein n=1 Tax=Actinoplanes sp. NPDC020271 TaxID=3363896 RepID=UPI0037A3F4FE
MNTSYLDRSLENLLRAARDLQIGSSATTAGIYGMPNGYMFQFGGAAEDVYLQILHMPDLRQDDPWIGVTRVWDERISVAAFIRATIRMTQAVSDAGAGDSYGGLWGNRPFPAQELAVLKQSSGA